MQINLTIYATGTGIINNKLRYKCAQTDSPGAIVFTLTEDPPHTFPHAVTLTVPNPVPHIVQIFSTPDASDGQLVATFMYDPSYKNIEVRMPLELNVGGSGPYDPVSGSNTTPILPDMAGWDWYPEVRGMGGHLNTSEYIKNSSVPDVYDSFSLTGDAVFYAPDFVFIIFMPKISIITPQFTYQDLYTDVITIDGSSPVVTMDAGWLRKVVEINTTGTAPVINLLPIASIPNNALITFSTVLGLQNGCTINADGSDTIFSDVGPVGTMFMGAREVLQLLRRPDGLHMVNDFCGMARTGVLTDIEIIRPNMVIFNGGGLVVGGNPAPIPRATNPRAEWYVMTQAPVTYTKIARDAGGDALSGFWAYDATYLYAPDYRGTSKRALPGNRGNDSTRDASSFPGTYKPDKNKPHSHFMFVNEVRSGPSSFFPPQVSPTTSPPAQFSQNNNQGGAGFIMIESTAGKKPTVGLTSETGDVPEVGTIGETVGKTVGIIAGCYI